MDNYKIVELIEKAETDIAKVKDLYRYNSYKKNELNLILESLEQLKEKIIEE